MTVEDGQAGGGCSDGVAFMSTIFRLIRRSMATLQALLRRRSAREPVLATERVDHPAGPGGCAPGTLGQDADPVGLVAPASPAGSAAVARCGQGFRARSGAGRSRAVSRDGGVHWVLDRGVADAWPSSAGQRGRPPTLRQHPVVEDQQDGGRPGGQVAGRWRLFAAVDLDGGWWSAGHRPGATPISPQNGMTGRAYPGRNSARAPTTAASCVMRRDEANA